MNFFQLIFGGRDVADICCRVLVSKVNAELLATLLAEPLVKLLTELLAVLFTGLVKELLLRCWVDAV